MTEILQHYQTYVPSISCEKNIPGTGIAQDKKFVTTLVGGDYLSVARARGAQLIRSTSELTKHSLGGMLPVAEDWHAVGDQPPWKGRRQSQRKKKAADEY